MHRHGFTLTWKQRVLAMFAACATAVVAWPAASASAATTLSLNPTSGPAGTTVTASGSNFKPAKPGTLNFGTTQVATFTTTATGGFNVTFAVPANAAVKATTVTAAAGGNSRSTRFTVVKSASPSTATTTSTTSTTVAPSTTTTTAPSTTTSTTTPPATNGFVQKSGTHLTLNGADYRFTGVNNPDLTTDYAINYGCGQSYDANAVNNMFASLRPNSMVRVWAFQSIAYNKNTKQFDFATFDRVVQAAAQYNQKVIFVLAHQWGGGCGEVYKNESWYATGYKQVVTDGTAQGAATDPLPYWDWVRTIVPRYANAPSVGMWEPMNEPNPTTDASGSTCTSTAATTLRNWFDAVGGLIHSLDANHLVVSGLQGSGQCGAAGTQFQSLHQSAGIDVGTVHDYYAPTAAMGGDQWNGIQVRLNQMAADNKPLFVEEVGINTSDTGGSTTTRRDDFQAKMNAQMPAGMVGYMPWTYSQTNSSTQYYITASDPTLTLLHNYSL